MSSLYHGSDRDHDGDVYGRGDYAQNVGETSFVMFKSKIKR